MSPVKRMMLLLFPALIVFCLGLNSLKGVSFPVSFYDYYQPLSGLSAEVSGIGGVNTANPHSSHSAFYNPALLAFRETASLSVTYRYLSESRREYDTAPFPDDKSVSWYRDGFSYIGLDSQNYGVSYVSLTDLSFDKETHTGDQVTRTYLDYYLDAYRFSFAEKSGSLSFGFNLSLLKGRVVYLKETLINDLYSPSSFVDSGAWGYGIDFGAVVQSGSFAYGIMFPNLLSKVYWRDHPNRSLIRKLNAGIQWGDEYNYIVSGWSGKLDFSTSFTHHIGIQRFISLGLIRGEYQYVPFRAGIFTKRFERFKDIGYSFGSGYRYSALQVDFSYMKERYKNKGSSILLVLSVGL